LKYNKYSNFCFLNKLLIDEYINISYSIIL